MKIYIGADHGGFALKNELKPWLEQMGHVVEDCGATELNPEDDYPDFSFAVAQKVVADAESRGVLLCRSGGGVTIAANKVKGIRAVNVVDVGSAQHARADNNANVIGLSADGLQAPQAKQMIQAFLETPYSEAERHERRLEKIAAYEHAN